jgi:hypothetical protein
MLVKRWFGVAAVVAGVLAGGAAPASAVTYAPVNTPGPALSVAPAQLAASVTCTGDLAGSVREPVLLLPATGVNSDQNYAWNYERAFRANGTPFCTSDQPGDANSNLGDIQTRAEYVTYAIRRTHELAGRRIAVLGHSQGGMVMRWSLRFWPDTRTMIADVIGMAGSNHGTLTAVGACAIGCAPASGQQAAGSEFIKALNSAQETFAGIDYTEAYTHNDQVVTPNLDSTSGSSSLRPGPGRVANVAIQDICPADPAEHLAIGTTDAVAYALVDDALTHDGPADPARIDRAVCLQPFQPGVDSATVLQDEAASSAALAKAFGSYPNGPEPRLRCYVTAACLAGANAGTPGPSGTGTATPSRSCASRRRLVVHVDRIAARHLRFVRVTLDGRALKLRGRRPNRTVLIDLRGVKRTVATLRVVGRNPRGGVTIRTHRYRTCTRRA